MPTPRLPATGPDGSRTIRLPRSRWWVVGLLTIGLAGSSTAYFVALAPTHRQLTIGCDGKLQFGAATNANIIMTTPVAAVRATQDPGGDKAAPGGSYDELNEAAGRPKVVEFSSPKRVSRRAHTSAPLTLAIKNTRSDTRSYKLVVTASSGVEVSGLPNSVVLAPGESKTLTVTLTAGDPSESAFFEINASHEGGDATDAKAAITEVTVCRPE